MAEQQTAGSVTSSSKSMFLNDNIGLDVQEKMNSPCAILGNLCC